MIKNPVIPEFELGTLIGNLIAAGIIIAGILTLFYLVWGGIQWLISGGDKAGLETARERITNAIIGLILVVASWAIITLISNFLGFPFPCLPIPSLTGERSSCLGKPSVSSRSESGQKPSPKAGKPGDPCQIDNDCDSKVCHFTKCAAGCAGFSEEVCWTHVSCEFKNGTCQYRPGLP